MGLKREAAALAFMVSLMALCGACYGAVYKVGDSAGWTNQGHVKYQKWASSKIFYVGDIIVFEYDKVHQNVVELPPLNVLLCVIISRPRETYSTGKDYITLYKPGFFSFTCGLPGHCQAGQRVLLIVLPRPSTGQISSPTPSQAWAPTQAQLSDSSSMGQVSSPTPSQSWAPASSPISY